jgi:hypothetical protein
MKRGTALCKLAIQPRIVQLWLGDPLGIATLRREAAA